MLSNKMTVSLISLITIFALASAMAQDEFKVTVTGRTSVAHEVDTTDNSAADTIIAVTVETAQNVPLPVPTILTFQQNGLLVDSADTNLVATIANDTTKTNTGKMHYFNVTVPLDGADADDLAQLPLRVVVTVPALTTNDPTVTTDKNANKSKAVNHVITVTRWADDSGLPKVVSIQRLRPGSQTVVAAFQEERVDLSVFPTFDVRVVITGRPHKDDGEIRHLEVGDIEVEHGTATTLVVGVPFAWHGGRDTSTPPVPIPAQAIRPHPVEGMYEHAGTATTPYPPLQGVPAGVVGSGNVPMPTGSDNMYHQYRVTITPNTKSADFNVKIKVKNFHDGDSPVRNTYISPGFGESVHLPNGREILTVPVKGAARDLTAGYKVTIPKDWIIPANGYLVIAADVAGSHIEVGPGPAGAWRTNDTPRATHRTPEQLKYNVIGVSNLPNLARQFLNGVVVDVVSQHPGLVVSEVMWGEDVSLNDRTHSQYIELYNSGAQYKTIADKDETPDVNEALTLIFYAPNEFNDVPAVDDDGDLPDGITDRIGTLDAKGAYWSPVTKGQSGSSGVPLEQDLEVTIARTPITPIVSMYRVMDDDLMIEDQIPGFKDGQMEKNWGSSHGPKSANFRPVAIGVRHGTPGAATDATDTPADTAAEAKAKADAAAAAAKKTANTGTYPKQGQGRVYISEVMFAGGGRLPQWIEISNGDRSTEFNLSGWTLTVVNAAADADVDVGAIATFTIPDGTTIDPSAQSDTPSTILIVTEKGRTNMTGPLASGQIINLAVDNEVELITAGVLQGKYTLLSDMAFQITLAPPVPKATKAPAGETAAAKATRLANEKKERALRAAATDMVGNLGKDGAAAWALPSNVEDEDLPNVERRSSIIRRHVQVVRGPAAPEDGMMEDNWVLASDTSFAQITHIRASSYYGAANDVGTPGFRAGGALPVELSHFRPARQKDTGAVVITWSTQSELNNAGFFIKRSQQRDGEFKVINATMIAGAGTTSEKQFYTFTDTTAQPNIVYYYQIEDVSLDGNRQTLTRGIRLKGHIGAAGKATTLWGELKTSHE